MRLTLNPDRGNESAVNCDECREQVLELIEREAVDPDGVREILARCPDCRADFDEMKAMLAVAAELPLEAPPDHVDVSILHAAEARTAAAAPPRWVWRHPIAMAAVALLAVGIGVSTVTIVGEPTEKQLAQAPAAEDRGAAEPDDAFEAEEIVVTEAERFAGAQATPAEPAAATPEVASSATDERVRNVPAQSARKKETRKAKRASSPSPVEQAKPARLAQAETGAGMEAAPSEPVRAEEQAPEADLDDAIAAKAGADEESRCEDVVSAFEKQGAKDAKYRPTPEEQLEAGLCYQLLENREQARRWLTRAAEHRSTRARAREALERLE